MTFSESIKTCFKKYFDSEGRATRAEYWWFQLLWWCVIIFGITMMFATKGDTAGAFAIVWMLFFALCMRKTSARYGVVCQSFLLVLVGSLGRAYYHQYKKYISKR